MASILALFAALAMFFFFARKFALHERGRRAAVQTEVDSQRARLDVLSARASAATPVSYPDWAKRLSTSIKSDALRVLSRLAGVLAMARNFSGRDSVAAGMFLGEISATLGVVESMLSLADEFIPQIVEQERTYAREILGELREIRREFEAYVRLHAQEGLPFEEEVKQVALLEDALGTDETVIASDPRGAIAHMSRHAAQISGIGRTVHIRVAVRDHIAELGKSLPRRIEEAQAAYRGAEKMLRDMRATRPGHDWDQVEKLIRSIPGLIESARSRIKAAENLCASKEGSVSAAFAEAVAAESDMATVDGRLLAIMEIWSQCLGPDAG